MGGNTRYIVVGPIVLVAALVLALTVAAPASGTPNYAYGLGDVTDLVDDVVEELEDTVDDVVDDPDETVDDTLDDPVGTVAEEADGVTSVFDDDEGDEGDAGDESEGTGADEEPDTVDAGARDTRAASIAASTAAARTVTAGLPARRSGGTVSSLQGFRVQSHHATDTTAMSAPPLDDVLAPVTRDTSEDGAAASDEQALLTADRQSVAAVPQTAGPSAAALLAGGLLILVLMGAAWLAGLRPEDPSGAS